jgi:heat-inducible transcriptional repressor
MIDLTARQIQILRAVIEEFINTADAVGSETIDRKYTIGVSPATIRNEMVYLEKQGYLRKSHSSAGRIPTPLALKLYVNELMKEKELSVADEVSAKEKIWNSRNEIDELLYQMTKVLADKSKALAVTIVDDDRIYHSGYANLLQMPEFFDIKVMRNVLQLSEEIKLLEEIFESGTSENLVQVIYGPELGNKNLEPVGMIHMSFMIDARPIKVGVLGSSRFDYPYVIPIMKYLRGLIREIVE